VARSKRVLQGGLGMNRTKGIFVVATLIVGLAVTLAMREGPRPVPPRTPTPTPPPVAPHNPVAENSAVSLANKVSHPYIAAGRAQDVFVQIDLQGKAGETKVRLPLNVGLVIDRSGSMAGRKLAHAKAAARRLVSSMSDGDRIAIVTYGSDVTTLVPSRSLDASSRREILGAIERIVDRGGTFLSGGLQRATQAIATTLKREQVSRVILISDGQANEGITQKAGLSQLARQAAKRGIAVTTMGVGLDFNEDVMTAIAEHGNGHYYYIKNASSLAGIFSRELSKLVATVARRPTMTITLDPNVELLALYGYEYDKRGKRIEIRLPEIFAKQQRRVTLKLRVAAGGAMKRSLARVELGFQSVDDGRGRTLVSAIEVSATRDEALVQRSRAADVLARGQQVELARTAKAALDDYRKGNVASAQAQIKHRLRSAMRANKRLRSRRLKRTIRKMRSLLDQTAAAPSSAAGRATIKAGKAEAYRLAK
jgi:Ca-activated chloride channel family protein